PCCGKKQIQGRQVDSIRIHASRLSILGRGRRSPRIRSMASQHASTIPGYATSRAMRRVHEVRFRPRQPSPRYTARRYAYVSRGSEEKSCGSQPHVPHSPPTRSARFACRETPRLRQRRIVLIGTPVRPQISRSVYPAAVSSSTAWTSSEARTLGIDRTYVRYRTDPGRVNRAIGCDSRGDSTRTGNPRFWRPVLCQIELLPCCVPESRDHREATFLPEPYDAER